MSRSIPGSAALFLLLAAACAPMEPDGWTGAEGPGDVGSQAAPLYYLTTGLWEHRDVPVCFTFTDHATERAWIEETLRGQRAWSAAGDVNLVGWGTCSGSGGGIRVQSGQTMTTSRLGEANDPDQPTTVTLDLRNDVHLRYTRCSENGLNRQSCIRVEAMHELGHALGFAHEQNRADTPASCTEDEQGSDGNLTYGDWDPDSIMNYCNWKPELSALDRIGAERAYGSRSADTPHLADYDGDGRDDLLCHDVIDGRKWIDYGWAGFNGTEWFNAGGWCKHDTARLYTGDFNGDGHADLLCHDVKDGRKWIDFANPNGGFAGTNWFRDAAWCKHEGARLFIGDFNGDGRDDLLCHDVNDGRKWIDFADAAGHFDGTDWYDGGSWCVSWAFRLHVGDFNGDGRADLLCHSTASGKRWVSLADASGHFDGTDFADEDNPWCRADAAELFVGDFNGDGRDDLLCFNAESGGRWIDYAAPGGQLWGTNWSDMTPFCKGATRRLYVGDVSGDGRDDLVCHDVVSGEKWVDYAGAGGTLYGSDWHRDGHWCDHDGGELH